MVLIGTCTNKSYIGVAEYCTSLRLAYLRCIVCIGSAGPVTGRKGISNSLHSKC